MEPPIDLESPEQVKDYLEAEESFGNIVARVLLVRWDDNSDDAFLWSVNGCGQCSKDLVAGEDGLIWGEPVGNGKYVTMHTYCTDECVTAAIHEWHKENEPDKELVIVWYGSGGD